MQKVSLLDIKGALRDDRFRSSLPESLKPAVEKYLSNPGCACNTKLYSRIISECTEQLKAYFPGKEVEDEKKALAALAQNNFTVINCPASDLEARLKKLPPGRKQIAIARWEDQVTCIVNELDVIF